MGNDVVPLADDGLTLPVLEQDRRRSANVLCNFESAHKKTTFEGR